MDAKIRLQIATALDAAGINATKAQVDALAKSVGGANAKMSTDYGKLGDAVGKLPGKFGEIGKHLGGLAGKASVLAGAFATGYEIGGKLRDMLADLIPAYDKYINSAERAEKRERARRREVERAAKAYGEESAAIAEAAAAGEKAGDKLVAAIERQTKAYFNASKAKSALLSAGDDAEMAKLERERFEDVMTLRRNGENDAAEQVDRMYDVYRAELETKRQIAKFDRETADLAVQREAEERKVLASVDKTARIRKTAETIQSRIDELDRNSFNTSTGMWNMSPAEYQSQRKSLEKSLQAARDRLAEAQEKVDDCAGEFTVRAMTEDALRAAQRSNLLGGLSLEEDRARAAYDAVAEANGNVAGLSFTTEYLQRAYDTSMDSYKQLIDIQANTSKLAEKLDALLQLKGE